MLTKVIGTAGVVAVAGVLFSAGSLQSDRSGENALRLLELGRAIKLYANDYDGLMPLAQVHTGKTWTWNRLHDLPETRTVGESPHFSYWANALRPYGDVRWALAIDGATSERMGTTEPVSDLRGGWTYNGLLHAFAANQVAVPDRLPLLWMGYGKINFEAKSGANPVLSCMMPVPECAFSEKGPQGMPGMGGALMVMRHEPNLDDEGAPFLSVDLVLTHLVLGGNVDEEGKVRHRNSDPYAQYSGGKPMTYWTCGESARYPCFFSPSNDFRSDLP